MNTPGLLRCAGALVALAIVSACGSGSPVAPSTAGVNVAYIGTSAITVGRANPNMQRLPGYPVIVPDKKRSSKYYVYIINYYGSYATIFNYPKNVDAVGYIQGDGGQGCTNVLYGYGKKIIWNVGGKDAINEYRIPQKLLKTLKVSFSFPSSCAMDTSGDLAVGILDNYSGPGGGDVVIFKNASGSGTVYTTPLDEEFFDGYDPKGDLFADGFTGDRTGFELIELPAGSSKFRAIKTSNSVGFPGSVQWDGKYMTVFDQYAEATYQYTITGTTASLQHTVQLSGSGDCAQTWLVKGLLYCGDASYGGEVYKYPAGGSPIGIFNGNFDTPLGATAGEK